MGTVPIKNTDRRDYRRMMDGQSKRIFYLAPNSNLDSIICRRLKSGNCRIKIQSRFFEIAP